MRKGILYFSIIGWSSAVNAENSSSINSGIGSTGAIQDVIVGLVFVMAMIFLLAWVAKKIGRGTLIQQGGMKVISSMSLGTREKIVLVEIDRQRLLLGVTASGISRLHTFELPNIDSQNFCEKRLENEEVSGEKWDFSKYLKRVISDGLYK